MQDKESDYFVVQRSQLNTSKLFVEFYLPKNQILFEQLRQGKYPLLPLKQLSIRLFDGLFGSNRKVEMYQESGIPYIRVKDVLPDRINVSELTYISEEKHKELIRSRVVPSNVLLTIAGRIGTAAVFPDFLKEGNITGHIAGIELTENINPHYLATFLNSPLGEFQFTLLGHRATRPELNLSEVGQVLVPVPPRPVQDRIAQVMQDAYTAQQEKFEQAKQSFLGIEDYMLEVLDISKDLPTDKPQFLINQSQLHRFDVRYFSPLYTRLEYLLENGRYSTKALNSICVKISNGLTPSRTGYTKDGCVVIKVASLTKLLQLDWQKVAFTSKEFFEKAKKAHVKNKDLLILSASHQLDYIGRNFALVRDIPAKYTNQCMTVGELIIIRTNHQLVLPEYLLACFTIQPIQELVNRMTRGQTAHLYAEDLQHLRVPVPPLKVQQTIIAEIDSRRAKAKRLRTEAETLIAETKARVERMILGEEEVE